MHTSPLPVRTFDVRRFWARWLDLSLYSGLWWIGMWAARQDIEAALLNPWVMFFQYLPWFVIEPLLLHYFGTTPGKWLLNLAVVNHDGSRLDLPAAIRRSLRVMFTGVGFGWIPLALFCHVLSIFTAKRLGTTLWDHAGGHRVIAGPLHPARVTAVVVPGTPFAPLLPALSQAESSSMSMPNAKARATAQTRERRIMSSGPRGNAWRYYAYSEYRADVCRGAVFAKRTLADRRSRAIIGLMCVVPHATQTRPITSLIEPFERSRF